MKKAKPSKIIKWIVRVVIFLVISTGAYFFYKVGDRFWNFSIRFKRDLIDVNECTVALCTCIYRMHSIYHHNDVFRFMRFL